MEKTAQQRATENLAFWKLQATRLEQDRKNLKWIPIVGLPAAAIGFYFKLLVGAAMLATVVTAGIMGLYLTTVRRWEYAAHVRDAEQERQDVEKRAS